MSNKTFNVTINITLENNEYFNSPFMAAVNFYKKFLQANYQNLPIQDNNTIIVQEEQDYYSHSTTKECERYSVKEIKDFIKDLESK